jgi:hypothetical protein
MATKKRPGHRKNVTSKQEATSVAKRSKPKRRGKARNRGLVTRKNLEESTTLAIIPANRALLTFVSIFLRAPITSIYQLAQIMRDISKTQTDDASQSTLPNTAEYLLYLLLPRKDRESIIGDLYEEYPLVVKKFGVKKAKLWVYRQVLCSAWPLIQKATKWGLFAWIGEWIRRRI